MHARVVVVVAALLSAPLYAQQPAPSFIKPYPGQKYYSDPIVRDFDEIWVPAAKVKQSAPSPEWKKLEGKVVEYTYDMPEGRSTLEVFKNYEQALTAAGFKKVFACALKECGENTGMVDGWQGAQKQWVTNEARYLLAKLDRPSGNIWTAVYVNPIGLPLTKVIVVEEKPMEGGLVEIDAAAMKSGLEQDGHIAVYGITFDTGQATLKPDSAKAFEQIKQLLTENPKLKIYVVGHTDDVGDPSKNVTLSNQRAAAVLKELTTRHKIDARRLKSYGVGPYVPVASNRNEQGRSKNRRVELVEDVE